MGTLVCMCVTIQRVLLTLYRGLELQIAKTPRTTNLWYHLQMTLHFVQIQNIQGAMLSPIWHIAYGRQYCVIKGCNSIFSILGFPNFLSQFRFPFLGFFFLALDKVQEGNLALGSMCIFEGGRSSCCSTPLKTISSCRLRILIPRPKIDHGLETNSRVGSVLL